MDCECVHVLSLRHIRSKEKDLALLSNIPAEQFAGFERLRRDNGAKTIQRNWRAVQDQRAGGMLMHCIVYHAACAAPIYIETRPG
jgi:hypothetical protein